MELVPCVQCKRHVDTREARCPFCTSSLPARRAQLVFAGRVTRAAIFSAAVVACGTKDAPPPAPAPVTQPAGSNDDDLEQMLDGEKPVAVPRAPGDAMAIAADPDAGVPVDAMQIAAEPDAGVPVDAGVDPAVAERLRKERQRKREEAIRRQQELERQRIKIQVNNKPYGAPPARRRVV